METPPARRHYPGGSAGVRPPAALTAAVQRAYRAEPRDTLLARRVGVSRSVLARIAAGLPVRVASILVVAAALEVDI